MVVGVAGATSSVPAVVAAGVAGLVGGAVSMGLGEYVSVSSQRDSQRALIEKERRELREDPEGELLELAGLYRARGLSEQTAQKVAEELTEHDALKAHLGAELNISEEDVVSAWHASWVSGAAFTTGAILPLLAILLAPTSVRVPSTFLVVVFALIALGIVGAKLAGSSVLRPTMRVLIGGTGALAVTFAIGRLLGTSGLV
jgi:VIT1/CCC1 family predicted Fe2+/Mn2+ transporter